MTIRTLDELSAKLVELESHPGREHLRRYPPGRDRTAVGNHRCHARPTVGRPGRPDRRLRAGQRSAYPAITELFDAVDTINTAVAKQLAPLLTQIDAAGVPVPKDVTDLLAVSASDPLSLTAEISTRRIAAISELVAFKSNWPDGRRRHRQTLDALRDAILDATHTRESATQKVLTGPLPVADDTEPTLRAELDSMTAPIRPPCETCSGASNRRCNAPDRTRRSRRACSIGAPNSKAD